MRAPQRAGVGRTDPQHRREAHPRDVGQPAERALPGHRAEAFAVEHQLGSPVGRQLQPPVVDRVDHHPAGLHRLLPVAEERNPARQKGILRSDHRGVAVVHHLQRSRGHRVDPPGAGGRDDHQQLAVECAGAFEFAQQHRHSALVVVGGAAGRRTPGSVPWRAFRSGASAHRRAGRWRRSCGPGIRGSPMARKTLGCRTVRAVAAGRCRLGWWCSAAGTPGWRLPESRGSAHR